METGARFKMKNTTLLILLFFLLVSSITFSQENYLGKRITISESQIKLKKALNIIGEKAGFEWRRLSCQGRRR